MTSVSVSTPKAWISPCLTGWLVVAVAAAFGALPIPASFEKIPRLTPCMSAAPKAPPAAWSKPNAFFTISASTLGSCVMLVKMTKNATPIYRTANTTTMDSASFAMRLTPPKIIVPNTAIKMSPNVRRFVPNAFSKARLTVF